MMKKNTSFRLTFASLLFSVLAFSSSLAATEQTKDIVLLWDNVEGADEYKLVEKQPGQSNFVNVYQGKELKFTVPERTKVGIYQYKVIACVENNSLSPSVILCESAAEYSDVLSVDLDGTKGKPIVVEFTYDALGRLRKKTDPTNGDRNYIYDKAGNRESVTVSNK